MTVLGAGLGVALAPGTSTYLGPLQTEVNVRPSLHPGARLDLPPAGQVSFDTHRAPVLVTARITSVDLNAASRLVRSPAQILTLEATAADTMSAAVLRAGAYAAGCGLLGAGSAGFLIYRGWRRTAQTSAACLVVLVATTAWTALTFEPAALTQPRFSGVLSQAPYIVTSTRAAIDQLQSYRSGLSQVVRDVSTLYAVSAALPGQGNGAGDRAGEGNGEGPGGAGLGSEVTTLLDISDVHLNPLAYDLTASLIQQFDIDAIVDTGDVTTWGSALESTTLERIGGLGLPYVFVRGNHDSPGTAQTVARQRGAVVLESGQSVEVAGLRIAGIGDPRFTADPDGQQPAGSESDIMGATTTTLATAITQWDGAHPSDPVDIAILHNPSALQPLMGKVPLVLAGHTHKRAVELDDSGTRVMVQGTTGGGGVTAGGLGRLYNGKPLPLSATLLHFATSGPRRGELIAYDEITVGGLGLAEVQMQRTVIASSSTTEGEAELEGETASPTTSSGAPSPARK